MIGRRAGWAVAMLSQSASGKGHVDGKGDGGALEGDERQDVEDDGNRGLPTCPNGAHDCRAASARGTRARN